MNEVNKEGYSFKGYIFLYDNDLEGHVHRGTGLPVRISRDAVYKFRKDFQGKINCPVTVDHKQSVLDIKGKVVRLFQDSKGVAAELLVKDEALARHVKSGLASNLSAEIVSNKFKLQGGRKYIEDFTVHAVSFVQAPADTGANVYSFSLGNNNAPLNVDDTIDTTDTTDIIDTDDTTDRIDDATDAIDADDTIDSVGAQEYVEKKDIKEPFDINVLESENITDYSNTLRNLGFSQNEANKFISKIKKFANSVENEQLKEENKQLIQDRIKLIETIEKLSVINDLNNIKVKSNEE